jgi:flagellar hook-associated protein 2
VFTGVSQYSGDLQSILTRAVQIAQLPVTALQSQEASLISKATSLGTLQGYVNSVAQSMTNLSTLAANQALTATSSDSSIVTATVNGNMSPTTYTITNLTSIAAAASETSTAGFADGNKTAVSASGVMKLTLGSQTATLNLTSATNNLVGLAKAINTAKDAAGNSIPVTATIITSADNADYLSVTANTAGANTLTLMENPGQPGSTDFLTTANQGADTVFTLNGNISVDSQSTTINNVIPGLTLNFLKPNPSGTVTVSLNSDPSQLSTALNSLVSSYNDLVDQVNAQVGTGGGALAGDSIISMVQDDMRQLLSYQGTGAIRSLSDVGIQMGHTGTLGVTGKMTFDSSVVTSLSDSQLQSAFTWLGSSTKGFASLAGNFTQLGDPISGVIQSEAGGYNTAAQNLDTQALLKATRISQMQASLQLQLAKADSMIAGLESQQNMLSSTIQAMNYASYGYQSNPNG